MYHCIQALSRIFKELGSVPVYKSAPYRLAGGLKAALNVWFTSPAADWVKTSIFGCHDRREAQRRRLRERSVSDDTQRDLPWSCQCVMVQWLKFSLPLKLNFSTVGASWALNVNLEMRWSCRACRIKRIQLHLGFSIGSWQESIRCQWEG